MVQVKCVKNARFKRMMRKKWRKNYKIGATLVDVQRSGSHTRHKKRYISFLREKVTNTIEEGRNFSSKSIADAATLL